MSLCIRACTALPYCSSSYQVQVIAVSTEGTVRAFINNQQEKNIATIAVRVTLNEQKRGLQWLFVHHFHHLSFLLNRVAHKYMYACIKWWIMQCISQSKTNKTKQNMNFFSLRASQTLQQFQRDGKLKSRQTNRYPCHSLHHYIHICGKMQWCLNSFNYLLP